MSTPEIDPRMVRRMADMHAVYRMFDGEKRLLYVGRTADAGRRFGDHSSKRWFPLVETITLEWFPTEAAAVLAERRAIRAERPRYNIAETPKSRSPIPRAALTTVPPARVPSAYRPSRGTLPRRAVAAAPATWAVSALTDEIRAQVTTWLADGTTASRVAMSLKVSKWTARVWLERLRDEGIAEVQGAKRGARWRLAKNGDGS